MNELPKNFRKIQARWPKAVEAMQALRDAVHAGGPLDAKTMHLAQIAASAAILSEGGVHSHVRKALAAGATAEEIRHVVILLVPTIGFPNVAAAMSWADDILGD